MEKKRPRGSIITYLDALDAAREAATADAVQPAVAHEESVAPLAASALKPRPLADLKLARYEFIGCTQGIHVQPELGPAGQGARGFAKSRQACARRFAFTTDNQPVLRPLPAALKRREAERAKRSGRTLQSYFPEQTPDPRGELRHALQHGSRKELRRLLKELLEEE